MLRKLCFIWLFLLMTGCSSKLAYNNVDWLIYWYLDDYVELDKKQKKAFAQHLDTWLSWHRKQELNAYLVHLKELKQDIESNSLNDQRWRYHMDYAHSHWHRLRQQLAPGLAELAVQLSDEQVIYLFAALEKDNHDIAQQAASANEPDKLAQRRDSFTQQISRWIGKPTSQQEKIIASYAPQFRSTMQQWLSYRRQIQALARGLFANRHTNPHFIRELRQLLLNADDYRPSDYLQNRQFNSTLFAAMAGDICVSLTATQKRKFIQEIQRYIDDITDLMEE